MIHSSVNDVDDGHDLSVDGAKKAANTPLQRLRSLGSPRPSPLMVNRATAMAELHLGEPALHSATEAVSLFLVTILNNCMAEIGINLLLGRFVVFPILLVRTHEHWLATASRHEPHVLVRV